MKALLIEARGLHLGYLGCYGNDWLATPALDRLAADGVVFDRHFIDNLGEDMRPCWTGHYLFPSVSPKGASPGPLHAALADINSEHRIVWKRCATNPCSDDPFGFAALLETLDALRDQPDWLLWAELPDLRPSWRLFQVGPEDVRAAVPDADDETVLPWLDPPCDFSSAFADAERLRLQNTYAAVVSSFDACLGDLLETLDELGLEQDLLLCVTAERGLCLGEHGAIGADRPWLHEELVHLPLIMRWPDRIEPGRRVSGLTQPIDLFPTLLESFGLCGPDSHGNSLWPLIRGEREQVRSYVCSSMRRGEAVALSLRCPDWAYLLPSGFAPDDPGHRSPQLYVKPDDRWEVSNVLQHHFEKAEQLERALRGFMEATGQTTLFTPPPLDAAAIPALTTS